jgi:hypothetical protein
MTTATSKAVPTRPRKADDHPFFCAKKKVRKSAWETPEYLTEADRAMVKHLATIKTPEEFERYVYEDGIPSEQKQGLAEGFFHRVTDWAEGLSYVRGSSTYRDWVFPKLLSDIGRAHRALFTPMPRAIRMLRDAFVAEGIAGDYSEINNGACGDFADAVLKSVSAGSEEVYASYDVVSNSNFMTGLDGDPDEDEVWDGRLLSVIGGLPRDWTIENINAVVFGYHNWIVYEGMHYDAECPEGVGCMFDLPIFKRYLTAAVLDRLETADKRR